MTSFTDCTKGDRHLGFPMIGANRRISDKTLTLARHNSMLVRIYRSIMLNAIRFSIDSLGRFFAVPFYRGAKYGSVTPIAEWFTPPISPFERHVGAVPLYSRREYPCARLVLLVSRCCCWLQSQHLHPRHRAVA